MTTDATGLIASLRHFDSLGQGFDNRERAIAVLSGPETLELLGSCNRLQPVMAVGRMQLSGGRRKVGVSEIADCDCQDRTTFEGPEHR
jgi:hypothetical protein